MYNQLIMSDVRIDRLTERALANAQALREKAITESARLALEADDRLVRKGNLENTLAKETIRLMSRMEWLYRHQYLKRFIGRSAIDLTYLPSEESRRYYNRPAIETPIILETGKTAVGAHVITTGMVFGRTVHRDGIRSGADQILHIFRVARDGTTGHEEREQPYELFWYKESNGDHRVKVTARSFEDYARQARAYEIERYTTDHPWTANYAIGETTVSRYRDSAPSMYDLGHTIDLVSQKSEVSLIAEELLPRLKQGTAWDYPDELYYEPLALVQQANDILGRRK